MDDGIPCGSRTVRAEPVEALRAIGRIVAISLGLALAACGKSDPLTPPEGRALPPAPYGSAEPPTAEQMLAPTAQARPGVSDELLNRSQRRRDDEFDLPPGTATPAPAPTPETGADKEKAGSAEPAPAAAPQA